MAFARTRTRTRTQCNGTRTRTRTRNDHQCQNPLLPTINSMFIGSRSITWRSPIRSRNRLAEQNSHGLLTTVAGGIWHSLEVRSPFLDEVLMQDGNLLLTGMIDTPGYWPYSFSDRQTPAHFSSRASRGFKT